MRARTLSLLTAMLAAATPALAAGREDTSGIFVWAFLGFCAVIVTAQVVPAILMMVGAAQGVAKAMHEAREEGVKAEIRVRRHAAEGFRFVSRTPGEREELP